MKTLIDIINKMTAEEPVLTEAQDYSAMFNPLWTMVKSIHIDDETLQAQVDHNVNLVKAKSKEFTDMAKKSLKKNDRIIWFLKLARISLAMQLASETELALYRADPEKNKVFSERGDTVFEKYATQEITTFSPPLKDVYNYQWLVRCITSLEHYLSLPIPAIQNTVFSNQNPEDLIGAFNDAERDWKESRQQILEYPPEEEAQFEVVLKFPDGKMWVNLNKAYCETEGKAMGHCGNKAAYVEGDTILSLREPIKHGSETKMRPLLTFILHEDGNLGEMKGRGNQKPAPQYHSYIIELLKQPIIKGIVGGGYAPERNFALTDLPEAEQDTLVEMKPELGSLAYQFRRFGMTDELIQKIHDKSDALGIRTQMSNGIQYDAASTLFTVDEMPMSEFIDMCATEGRRGNNNALKWAFETVVGENDIDTYGWVDNSNIEQLIRDLPDDLKAGLTAYCLKNYPSSFNEDGTHDEDLYDILSENNDDIIDAFGSAVADGMRSGTESEVYDDLQQCLKNWDALGFHLQSTGSEDGKHIYFDGPVKLVIKAKDLIDNLSNNDYCDVAESIGKWFDKSDGPKLEEPRNGWSGMDDGVAFDYLRENTDLLDLAKAEKEEAKEAIDFLKKRI